MTDGGYTGEKFAEAAKLESVSTAALLCKARTKIRWEAFREVFEQCAALAPVGKLYQGYELLAVDGMMRFKLMTL